MRIQRYYQEVRHHNVEADIEGNPQLQEPPRTNHLLLTYLNRNVHLLYLLDQT
ncbi:hypothetical protein H310_08477 [Aphanomyces invadans]|uniref:Uncharacterized protein n=1 Tax=Aphanomyces invadans TaxID=157072 RepID=A0A024TYE7_9STRA|nr:hypothetical protein H310_08477 [Aphanomyces invadans]ETV99004.1 hypothetical protein H310_08477 [Aphanomyces invadans]|eukprot:XP_008872432.1 hypothetical protein H310_08477 [Aphanomyces invadans]